ncbi:uncharacterized protein ATC70_007212 [Mucor velutinosus]|uniref:Uncharacterized protein n=1 Tax=Mucor velutinosus TaxID=708070 RepID=A0AAN7D4G3_9FUNG|nr:hypothetical protein ATC70_007212 [Mucor velutinosus]
MQPQDLSKASHFTSSIDVDPNSIDFGLTSLPPASATDQTALSTFMVEPWLNQRLLETPLRLNCSYQRSIHHQCCSYHHRRCIVEHSNTPSTTSASKSTPSYSQSQVTAQPSFAAVVASNAGASVRRSLLLVLLHLPPRHPLLLLVFLLSQVDIPSGYQFVYYATPVRRRLSELRRLVQGVGLNNSRVLDIQYPVQNVISFLVHNDYVLTLTKAMHLHGRGSSPLIDFDPCDPVNLKDPKFASLSRDLRVQKAIEVENLRCLRSLSFVPSLCPCFCCSFFLLYDRINQAQFDAILKEEMLARSSSSAAAKPPSRSSDQERLAKKQRLSYLGYLLHHDAETASLLAYAVSPTLSATKDLEMSESSDN